MEAFTRYRGDDWKFTVTITESNNGTKGPMDLTGATVKASIGSDPIIEASATIVDADDGVVRVEVPRSATKLLALKSYLCDVQAVKGGKQGTPFVFRITVLPAVTPSTP